MDSAACERGGPLALEGLMQRGGLPLVMAVNEVRFQSLLLHANKYRRTVRALDGAAYSSVMTNINASLRNNWHFRVPADVHAELVANVVQQLSSPKLSRRQADSLQRTFRGIWLIREHEWRVRQGLV